MRRVAASLLLSALATASIASAAGAGGGSPGSGKQPKLLEPVVRRHLHVLSEDACRELIRLGEEEGFTVDEESIDAYEEGYVAPSQSIEVFERYARNDGVIAHDIWAALEPWIPKLTQLVKDSIDKTTDRTYFPDKPDRTPQLGWVFFRKYAPDSDRKSLKLHVDSNMHTLNIALNHDFQGGGLLYIKPPAEQKEETYDDRPEIPEEYQNYDWLNGLKRENTSDVIFPTLEGGDVLIHNFTVWHAVAPIERGTRYSFVLFYDMDNPAIQSDFDEGPYSNEEDDDDAIPVSFYHEIEDMEIDLAFVDENAEEGEDELIVMAERMPPFEHEEMDSYEGHRFLAMKSGTGEVVSEFEITHDRHLYTIQKRLVPRAVPLNDPKDEL